MQASLISLDEPRTTALTKKRVSNSLRRTSPLGEMRPVADNTCYIIFKQKYMNVKIISRVTEV